MGTCHVKPIAKAQVAESLLYRRTKVPSLKGIGRKATKLGTGTSPPNFVRMKS